jgi:hypothetical protein
MGHIVELPEKAVMFLMLAQQVLQLSDNLDSNHPMIELSMKRVETLLDKAQVEIEKMEAE